MNKTIINIKHVSKEFKDESTISWLGVKSKKIFAVKDVSLQIKQILENASY